MSRMSPSSRLLDACSQPIPANNQMCPATFTRPQHVGRHVRSHTGDRPYECKECPLRFARRYVPPLPRHSITLPTFPSIHSKLPTYPPFIPTTHLHSIHRPELVKQQLTSLLVIFSLDTSTKLIVNKNQEQDPRRKERKEGESQCRLWLVSLISPLGQ